MKHFFKLGLFVWACATASAPATQVDFLFSGQITFSRDDAGWFQGALPLNGTFSGRIRYDTTLASKYVNPSDYSFAQYTFDLGLGAPVAMSLTGAGGHTFSSRTPFYINTYDNYGVNPSYPGLIPFDELYYAAYADFDFDNAPLAMNYYFADFGVHFYSTSLTSTTTNDLPDAPPELSYFADPYFIINVFSGRGGPTASIRGTITSITAVPEPAATAILFLGFGIASRLKRR